MMMVPLVAFLVGVNISVLYKVKCSSINFSGREILSAETEALMHSHLTPHEPQEEQLKSSHLWSSVGVMHHRY